MSSASWIGAKCEIITCCLYCALSVTFCYGGLGPTGFVSLFHRNVALVGALTATNILRLPRDVAWSLREPYLQHRLLGIEIVRRAPWSAQPAAPRNDEERLGRSRAPSGALCRPLVLWRPRALSGTLGYLRRNRALSGAFGRSWVVPEGRCFDMPK